MRPFSRARCVPNGTEPQGRAHTGRVARGRHRLGSIVEHDVARLASMVDQLVVLEKRAAQASRRATGRRARPRGRLPASFIRRLARGRKEITP